MIIADGLAPIKGPKNGMILVTPIMVLTHIVYGRFRMLIKIKQSTPIIAESMSLPLMKPPKVLLVKYANSKTASDRSLFNVAEMIFFVCALNNSLLLRKYTQMMIPIKIFNMVLRVTMTPCEIWVM